MHSVVQRASAALLFPGAPPPQIIIAMASPPIGLNAGAEHPARQPAVQQGFQIADGLPETILRDNRQLFPAFIPGAKHGVAFRQRRCHGLFADHVLPRPQAVDGNGRMGKGRRADVRQINVPPGQNLLMIVIHLRVQPVFFLHGLCFFRHNIHQRHNFAPLGKLQICAHMRVCNVARADNRYANHGRHLVFLTGRKRSRPSILSTKPV